MIWKQFMEGGTFTLRNGKIATSRLINLIPERMEQDGGKGAMFNYQGAPGFSQFATHSQNPNCLFVVRNSSGSSPANDRLFATAGTDIIEIDSAGTVTDRGNITTGQGAMASNGIELFITTGTDSYTFTLATNTLSAALGASGPVNPIYPTFQDGFFIAGKANTGQFYVSGLYDGNNWSSLDFATAEQSPDNTTGIINGHRELWIGGQESIEVWANTGGADFPYSPADSIEFGVMDGSLVMHDNAPMFIGHDSRGGATGVYRIQDRSPVRVSTHAVETMLSSLVGPHSARCFSYAERGHSFYVLSAVTPTSGSSLSTSLVFDSSTGLWHERANMASASTFSQLNYYSHVYAFGKHLVLKTGLAGIYEMNLNTFTDVNSGSGTSMKAVRTAPHISSERNRVFVSRVELDCKTGATWSLERSVDGGGTFGTAITGTGDPPHWNRLGSSKDLVLQVSTTSSVEKSIANAYIEVEAGRH